MMTFDEAQQALCDIADELPADIFDELNGGIVLIPDTRKSTSGVDGLYTLGQYHHEPRGLGRYIQIFYGSFRAVYGGLSKPAFKNKLREILFHELTHHVESLAGDRSLEKQDARDLAKYRSHK